MQEGSYRKNIGGRRCEWEVLTISLGIRTGIWCCSEYLMYGNIVKGNEILTILRKSVNVV